MNQDNTVLDMEGLQANPNRDLDPPVGEVKQKKKTEDIGRVRTEQFIAAILYGILDEMCKSRNVLGIPLSKLGLYDEFFKQANEILETNKLPILPDQTYYKSSEYFDIIFENAFKVIRELYPGIEKRIQETFRIEEGKVGDYYMMQSIRNSVMEVGFYKVKLSLRDFITDHLIAVFFMLLRSIASCTNRDNYKTFCCVCGPVKTESDFNDAWNIQCKNKYASIRDEKRGIVSNMLLLDEILEKGLEWLNGFSNVKIQPFTVVVNYQGGYEVIVHRYIDPGVFHEKVESIEFDFGTLVYNHPEKAKEIVEKNSASKGVILSEEFTKSKSFVESVTELRNKFKKITHPMEKWIQIEKAKKKAKAEGKPFQKPDNHDPIMDIVRSYFPKMLEKIVDIISETLLKLIVIPEEATSMKNNAGKLVRLVIERAFLGYYAYMNDDSYIQLKVYSNQLTEIKLPKKPDAKPDEEPEVIPLEFVFEKLESFIRRLIYESNCLFPIYIIPSILERIPLFAKLPISRGKRNNRGWTEWTFSDIMVPITHLVHGIMNDGSDFVNTINAAPNGVCMWIYATNDAARKRLKENNGDVVIDGKDYVLLIYNPNGEQSHFSKFEHVRGCWFALCAKYDKHTNRNRLVFKVLTRYLAAKIFGMTSISTTVTFKWQHPTRINEFYIVNYTYHTIPLPPLLTYEGKDLEGNNVQLMNEFPARLDLFKAHTSFNNNHFISKIQELGPQGNFAKNLLKSLLDLHTSIKNDGNEKIPLYVKIAKKADDVLPGDAQEPAAQKPAAQEPAAQNQTGRLLPRSAGLSAFLRGRLNGQ